jgi:hypothetical protein
VNIGTAVIASAVGVAWIGWYLGWRLRSRNGLRPTARARRASNALMGWVAFEGCVLTGTMVWQPALGVVLLLMPLWLLLRLAIYIVDRSQERSAQRRDLLNGYPPVPRPISWDNVPMVVLLLWLAIGYVVLFLTVVFLVAFAGPGALGTDLSTNTFIGAAVGALIPALLIGIFRKLRRDQAIRDYEALSAGIEFRVRAESGTQLDQPRDGE